MVMQLSVSKVVIGIPIAIYRALTLSKVSHSILRGRNVNFCNHVVCQRKVDRIHVIHQSASLTSFELKNRHTATHLNSSKVSENARL